MKHFFHYFLSDRTVGMSRRHYFSIIELLVVMTVMTILLGIMIPALDRLAIGSGVDGAAQAIGSQLRLVRQYAISNRERVALLMPSDDHSNETSYGENIMPERRWTAYRACIVNRSDEFVDWLPNSEWKYLPAGAAIAEISMSNSFSEPPADNADTIDGIDENDDGSIDYNNVRAIVFAPTGRLAGSTTLKVHIVEGFPAEDSLVYRNTDNYRTLEVDTYTGRTSYSD